MDLHETVSHETRPDSDRTSWRFDLLPSFKEHSDHGYRGRTMVNAGADLTIAIASDFDTAGERLTRKAVLEQGKAYCPIHYRGKPASPAAVTAIRKAIRSIEKPEITINIAGNGIYTLCDRFGAEQEAVDQYTFELLRAAFAGLTDKKITLIRSGGQTGFDEAGIKAGMSLGIPTEVLAPKGWKLRDEHGHDVSDEVNFKKRFVLHRMKLDYQDYTYAWHTYCFDLDDDCSGWDTFGFKRNEHGVLEIKLLGSVECDNLNDNVHTYFSYDAVMLDVRGCSGHRRHFQMTFHLNDALDELEETAFEQAASIVNGQGTNLAQSE